MVPSFRKLDARSFGAFTLRLWAILFVIPHFATNVIIQQNGVLFAFTGYYWLVDIGIIGTAFILAWKYDHPLTQLCGIAFGLIAGYISFRYLEERLWYFNPGMFIVDILMAVLLALNILRFFFGFLHQIVRRKFISRLKSTHLNRKTLIVTLLAATWFGCTAWSYFGFSQVYLVEDFTRADFHVSFYGLPSGDFDFSQYNTPAMDEELGLYQQLNSTIIFGVNQQHFAYPMYAANMTAVIHEFEEWGIEFICDCAPVFTYKNESSGEMIETSDYVTVYHLAEVNATIDLVMAWVTAEGFTNFRGISLDIEGPMYRNNSIVISKEQYELAKQSYSVKLNEFKAAFPGNVTNGISMEGTMWDPIDGDYDLDTAALTISNELDLDIYGYMTYHTGSASLSESDYRYASFLQHGVRQHGEKFQPWVGWWYDPKSETDPDVIENPIVYEQTIRQFKIAKSMGVKEVVLAPLRNFLGRNTTEGLDRLRDLIDIKTNGFPPFEIPITQDMRFFNDFPFWWKKVHSTYWISNDDVLQDILMGTNNNWLLWVQVGALVGTLCVTQGKLRYSRKRPVQSINQV